MKAYLVDDEPNALEVLAYEIKKVAPQLEIIHAFKDSEEALKVIQNDPPELLFLDIEMPYLNAFQMLDKLEHIDFKIIFTTAYDHYAIKAFRYYAIDYLLKPIDRGLLKESIERAENTSINLKKNLIQEIHHKINAPNSTFTKIALPTQEGYDFIEIENILRCEADSNYSIVYLTNRKKKVVSKPLKYLQTLLENHGFFRAHQSHLINLKYISQYQKNRGNYITMDDGSSVQVSRANRHDFEILLKGS